MKKILFTVGFSTLFLAACSESNGTAGLGDSYDDFVSAYGENGNDDSIGLASFQDNYILAMYFEDEFAFNIGLQFDSTDDYPRSMEESLESVEPFIPDDAEVVSEETVDYDDYVAVITNYTSESLAEKYEESGTEPFEEMEANEFTVILTGSLDNDDTYQGATVAIGHETP